MLIKRFSRKTAIGLDISDRSIELMWLGGSPTRPKYFASNRRELPGNLIENGKILDPQGLAHELKQTLKNTSGTEITSKQAIISIPSQAIVTDLVILDIAIPDQDIENEIHHHFMLHRKIKRRDYTFAYYQIETDSREKRAFFVAAAKTETLLDYISLLKSVGIKTVAIDLEPLAAARAVLPPGISRQWALLDCGANQTVFSVYDNRSLVYSETVPVAGDQFTTILANALKITGTAAEELKKTALSDDTSRSALEVELEPLSQMASAVISRVKSEYQLAPSTVLVAGGSSLIENFSEWWQAKLSLPVERARAFITFPAVVPDEVFYLTAIGLALRGIEKMPQQGFNLLPTENTPPKNDGLGLSSATIAVAESPITTDLSDTSLMPQEKPAEEPAQPKVEISLAPQKGSDSIEHAQKESIAESATRRLKIWLAILMLAIAAFPVAWLFAKGDLGLGMDDLSGIIDSTDDQDGSTLRQNVIVAISAEISPDKIDQGQLLTSTYTTTATVTATGSREEDGYASGTATIYNKTASSKVIISGSRLKTENGELFKTQTRVEVPSNGTRTVEIKAVNKGTDGDITPQKLTFVTLPNMTNSLYAVTSEKLAGGVTTVIYYKEEDLSSAQSTIQNQLQEDLAQATWSPALDMSSHTLVPELPLVSLVNSTCEADIAVENEENECSFTFDLIAVALNNEWFEAESALALERALSAEEKEYLYTPSRTSYTVTDFDETTQTVKLTIELQYSYS